MNETGTRKGKERRVQSVEVNDDSRKSNRRRHIDPTTCERDYNEQEIEFMRAMDDYKRSSGRMFPTCSEILEVLLELGYRKMECECGNFSPVAPVEMANDNLYLDDNSCIG
ncbi:MAG: hypothetical protein R3C03_19500 [Pirellulaceae bacterium]